MTQSKKITIKYKAIIFDLDGTLINSLSDIADSVNRVLSVHGFPIHSTDAYRCFIGNGAMTLIQRALPDDQRNEKTIQICHKEFKNDYRQHWNDKTSVYDGIKEMLDALCARNIRLSILSNKPHEFTIKCAQACLHQWPFEIVLGNQAEIPKKPDPAGALLIAQKMRMPASDFLYLGDTAVDMQTALAAGMFPAGALWGFRTKKELAESGAKALLNHPMGILSLLEHGFFTT
jgi:phosphoglycolate phosphatase